MGDLDRQQGLAPVTETRTGNRVTECTQTSALSNDEGVPEPWCAFGHSLGVGVPDTLVATPNRSRRGGANRRALGLEAGLPARTPRTPQVSAGRLEGSVLRANA